MANWPSPKLSCEVPRNVTASPELVVRVCPAVSTSRSTFVRPVQRGLAAPVTEATAGGGGGSGALLASVTGALVSVVTAVLLSAVTGASVASVTGALVAAVAGIGADETTGSPGSHAQGTRTIDTNVTDRITRAPIIPEQAHGKALS